MRYPAFAAALLLATIAGAASAQSPVAPSIAPSEHASLDPAAAPAGADTHDARHASGVWRVRHHGLGLYTARG
ncbi:MAG: hypothetical protein AB7T08_12265, partial [Hyphomonadaceae bacterium]